MSDPRDVVKLRIVRVITDQVGDPAGDGAGMSAVALADAIVIGLEELVQEQEGFTEPGKESE